MDAVPDTEMAHNSTGESHLTKETSVWSLIKEHLDSMVDQAIQRTHKHLVYGNDKMKESLSSFKQRLQELLTEPLQSVAPGHPEGQGHHTIHKEVESAVEVAVDEAMLEFNISDANVTNTSLSSVRERLVMTLDSEIELDVFNKVFTSGAYDVKNSSDFFHSMPVKDETMFVTLVCIAVIVPVVFLSLLLIFFHRRQNDTKDKRQDMLLQDQPEFSMDEYNNEDMMQPTLKVEVPDLDLQNLKA